MLKSRTNKQTSPICLIVERPRSSRHKRPRKEPLASPATSIATEYWDERKREAGLRDNAFLSHKDYNFMLDLWVSRGCARWRLSDDKQDKPWRASVRLAIQNEEKGDFISCGIRKPRAIEKQILRKLPIETKNDPLFFVNFCGVPPFLVLEQIEHAKIGRTHLKDYQDALGIDSMLKLATLTLRKARFIGPGLARAYQHIERDARLKGENLSLVRISDLEQWVNALEQIKKRQNGHRGQLASDKASRPVPVPQLRKKGGQNHTFFKNTVHNLYDCCRIQIEQRIGAKFQPGEKAQSDALKIGLRAIDGAVTATMYAAFSECFKKGGDPLRKVRSTVAAFQKISED